MEPTRFYFPSSPSETLSETPETEQFSEDRPEEIPIRKPIPIATRTIAVLFWELRTSKFSTNRVIKSLQVS